METKFDNRLKRQRDASAALSDHLLTRARPILSDAQFEKFQSFEKRNRRRLDDLIDNQQEWGRTKPFYRWLVDVYFFLLLPLTCVKGCGALTRDELQADTLGFFLTRPVSRARLLCVKFISQLAWLEILLLTETLLVFAAGQAKLIPDVWKLLPVFLGAQVLAVAAWGALGTFLGQITSRYVAIALVYGAVVEMGIGRIPTNINDLSIMRHLRTLLSYNEALQGIYAWPADNPWFSVMALAVAPVLFLGVASALFSFLEYLPASEMQK
jgi:ABC-type transport system involved in multi-copper enzyme maturation permease subunit